LFETWNEKIFEWRVNIFTINKKGKKEEAVCLFRRAKSLLWNQTVLLNNSNSSIEADEDLINHSDMYNYKSWTIPN
jgi:hypothetical protein